MQHITAAEDFHTLVLLLTGIGIKEFFAALIGTFFGGYFAFFFAQSEARKNSAILEDNNLIHAYQLAASFLSLSINLKHQHLGPKEIEFVRIKDNLRAYQANASSTNVQIEIRELWRLFAPINFSIVRIVEAVGKLRTVAGRPMFCAIDLEKDATDLQTMFQQYNQIANEISGSDENDVTKLKMIVGERLSPVLLDCRLPETLRIISETNNRMIFVSQQLAVDIVKHQKTWRNRVGLEKRKTLDLVVLEEYQNLIHGSDDYRSYTDIPMTALE